MGRGQFEEADATKAFNRVLTAVVSLINAAEAVLIIVVLEF